MDIYLIRDEEANWLYPTAEASILVSFKLDEFRIIEEYFSIFYDNNINFFTDFRLNSKEVEIILNKFINSNIYFSSRNRVEAINKMEKLLQKAVESNLGIIGFCD